MKRFRFRALLMIGLVTSFGWAFAASAQAVVAPADCVEQIMDLPALNACKDAQGRTELTLPAIGTLKEPATPKPASGKLPKTGMHTEDFMAIGMAALAGGAVLLRRLRLAVA